MKRRRFRDVIKAVDPNLNIIPGGTHRRSTLHKGEWEKLEGEPCNKCGNKVLRMIDGLCQECSLKRDVDHEVNKERTYYQRRLARGDISISTMKNGGV